jgi:2-polyprenyl-6-methoxyphenol hydroxylase-like FAD-dependent oxidoreductase
VAAIHTPAGPILGALDICDVFLLIYIIRTVCNPFGGLGLTGGIVDIGGLYDCLVGIFTGQADDSILDLYDSVRREKYNTFVDPVSSANLRLLFQQNPETAVEENETMRLMKKAETDEETAKLMKSGVNALMYDFTQHYKK